MTDRVISRRPPWRALLVLAVVALVARVGASFVVPDPAYLDAAYYELVARRLAEGHGFSVPVVWSFLETGGVLPADPSLPVPSNRHWMPLSAVVSAGSMAVLGVSRFAAELPHAILGAFLVPATAFTGWWLWRSRAVAIVAGVLALFAGPMLVYVPMVDSFALFGVFGFVAIAAAIRSAQPAAPGTWLLLSGLGIGLATLTRVDGVLLAVAPAVAWLARRRIGPWGVGGSKLSIWWVVGAVVVTGAVMAPWLARQLAEFGSILPSAGGRLLWVTDFNEQFSIREMPTPASYLAEGPLAIIGGKLEAAVLLLGRTAVLLGGAFVIPFLYGLVRERARVDLAPFTTYWLVMFAAMALLFTVHAPMGAYYHSAWAWLPFAIPLAIANALPLLEALGTRVRMLGRPRNVRFLGAAAVAGAVALSLIGSVSLVSLWSRDYARAEAAAGYLADAAGEDDVVMYVDPPTLHLLTGLLVVPPPFDPPEVIGEVAEAYDVRWVVIERAPGASTDALGLWDGVDWLAPDPSFEARDVRVFRILDHEARETGR
jgi:4-amino-4-deoxy-L-arabinose transferase-like glycosyltransferase